jgi:hypothetical protein
VDYGIKGSAIKAIKEKNSKTGRMQGFGLL